MNQTLKILMAVSFLLALAVLAETSPEVQRAQDASDKQGLAKASAKAGASSAAHIERIENGIESVEVGKNEPPVALDIEKLMKVYNVTGMSVAAIDDYKITWTKTYGVTEPGGTTLVTPKTLFQAGSISKPVAATGMLALVEQGKLSLDEDVNQRLKTWKVPENEFTKDKKVTLRSLASHSAGPRCMDFQVTTSMKQFRPWCRFSMAKSPRILRQSAWILFPGATSVIPAAESPSNNSS